MIVLSPRQKTVYDFLWHQTGQGAFPWCGWVRIPGVPRQTVNASLDVLVALGVIELRRTSSQKPATFRVLVPADEIEEAGLSGVMGARDARWAGRFDRPVRRDDGAFMRAVAGMPPPADAHPVSHGRFTGQRPDARAV